MDELDISVHILGISGSLRKASYNSAVLRVAGEIAETIPGITFEEYFLEQMPLYNEDIQNEGIPDVVKHLKEKVRSAQAILFVSPEYNYSIPGGLKNAIDWVSRPYGDNAWEGKPAGIMGASSGILGTARMQYHLRQTCVFLDMHPVNRPEVMIANVAEKFDENLRLRDEKTREKIREMLTSLAGWTRTLTSA